MKFWQQLLLKLQEGHSVYLITVISNLGSSPGRAGFKMLVSSDGFIFGSIGGGVMEYALVEEAKELLTNGIYKIFLKKQIHRGQGEHGSGMICSGEQSVVFHPLGMKQVALIDKILYCLQNGKKGRLELSSESIQFSDEIPQDTFFHQVKSPTDWLFEERIGSDRTMYIVGGGHVGLAVSELFVALGFRVVILDNRKNLNTIEINTSAHQKKIIDYNKIADFVAEGTESYIAIMTNKYTDDKLALKELLRKRYKYIGVLGSKAKLKTMWKELIKEGVSRSKLEFVHAPIGLPIKSQTPKEIAVSIAAEIIQIKNANK